MPNPLTSRSSSCHIAVLTLLIYLVAAAIACGIPWTASDTGATPDTTLKSSVHGNVTFRFAGVTGFEVEPTVNSVLEVHIVSVLKAGTPSETVAKQVIRSPAWKLQSFNVEYLQEDLDPGAEYAIQALLLKEDKIIAMSTAVHPMFAPGGTDYIDSLVLEPVAQNPPGSSKSKWTEVPAPVKSVSISETYKGYSIEILSYLPSGCYKFKGSEMTRGGGDILKLYSVNPAELSHEELVDVLLEASFSPDINVAVTNLKSTLVNSGIPVGCSVGVSYIETRIPIGVQDLRPGKTYNVIVNDELVKTFIAK